MVPASPWVEAVLFEAVRHGSIIPRRSGRGAVFSEELASVCDNDWRSCCGAYDGTTHAAVRIDQHGCERQRKFPCLAGDFRVAPTCFPGHVWYSDGCQEFARFESRL